MITVVSENYGFDNAYEGMNLAEACAQLQIDTNNILNEAQMDILLNEHTFLYENGYEIEYVNEDGAENEESVGLKSRMIAAWEKIRLRISALFDNLVLWVKSHLAEIKENLIKIGLNEKRVKVALEAVFESKSTIEVKVSAAIKGLYDGSELSKHFKKNAIPDDTECTLYKDLVTTDVTKVNKSKKEAEDAITAVFKPDHVIREIYFQKKVANDAINSIKKDFRMVKPDDLSKKMKGLNNAVKFNSECARQAIKVHHTWIAECVACLRAICKDDAGKDAIKTARSNNRKETFNKMNPKNVAAAMRDRRDARSDKKKEKVNAAKKRLGYNTSDEDSANESALYIGNFYNV